MNMNESSEILEEQFPENSQPVERDTAMLSLDPANKRDCPIHDVPDYFLEKWQCTIDTMSSIFEVPAGLIMRVLQNEIEVLVSSHTENNPYAAKERAPLKTGLYCETVMASQAMLHVPNALEDDHWKNNPDIALNMISYLGIPLFWKEKEIFGTICVLDRTTRNFPKKYIDILWELKKIIESDFHIIQQQKELASQNEEIKLILHDLRLHQVELEFQNDALRQSQAELEAARSRYFDLYDLAPVGYLTLSEKGLVSEANLTTANLLGVARGDLVRQPLSRFILKEDQEIYYRIRKQLLDIYSTNSGESGAMYVYELRMLKKDGTTFWAHLETAVQVTATAEAQAGASELRIILSDITLRKQAEWSVQERLKELNCLYGISALLELPGISLDEILTGTVLLLPPAWQFPEIAEASIVIREKNFQTAHFRETSWMQAREIIVNGKPIGQVEICYLEERPECDEGPFLKEERQLLNAVAERLGRITERILAEEARKASSSLLSAAMESTADGLLVVDSDRRVTTYNQKFAEMWKIPADVIASHDDDVLLNHVVTQLANPGKYLAKVSEMYAIPGEASFDQIEFVDGRVFERYSQPQIIGDNVVGRVWSFRDITARKRAEEALEEERRRLQQALDEVRTLRGIVPICSYCKKIRDDEGYWNQVEKYVSDHSEAKFSHGICPACFEREMKAIT